MCAKYLTFEEWKDTAFFEIVPYTHVKTPIRQIRPADLAPVFIREEGNISAQAMRWGFPMQRSGVIFNARVETLEDKRLFRDAFQSCRCIVPALGFYEWDAKNGKRHIFRRKEHEILYIAGIYQEIAEDIRFVIITTPACFPVSQVHARMPLVLHAQQAMHWLETIEQARQLCRVPHIQALIDEEILESSNSTQQQEKSGRSSHKTSI